MYGADDDKRVRSDSVVSPSEVKLLSGVAVECIVFNTELSNQSLMHWPGVSLGKPQKLVGVDTF